MGNQEETPNNLLENNNDSKEIQTELSNTNDNEVQNVGEGKEQRPVITLPKTEEKPNTVTIDGVEYSKDIVEKAKL
ncbi:MAG: hypothetical protein FK732_04030, partial [Asgard group archaeon]|nr:hypothetical protein [Asgard group archaeon]